MGHEINIDSIRDLERQIEEGIGDMIQLRRTRNSLLNISVRVPPEILGSIFRWNVIPDGGWDPRYGGLQKGSYNFLLVCHHWFEVASRTPEVWSFWGTTLKQWSRWHKRSGIDTPVDLTLGGFHIDLSALDGPLRNTLLDHAARGTIRSVQLRAYGPSVTTSVLSLLTPDDDNIRCSNIELIYLGHVDASKFFARNRFPKLWSLQLSGVKMSSWELLGLHVTALTTLYIAIGGVGHVPTTPQLLSILTSNPRLQNITLLDVIPRDDEGGSTRVPLHQLKVLSLSGDFHPIFRLLRQLDHPQTMDEVTLHLSRCAVEDIAWTLGPYVEECLRRNEKSRGGLGLFVISLVDVVSIRASAEGPTGRVTFATFTATLPAGLPPRACDELCIDFVAQTPGGRVVYFGGDLSMGALRGIVPAMPKIQELHLVNAMLSSRFLQPNPGRPRADTKLFPSLQHLHLEDVSLGNNGWSPLLPFLAHQTSGGQAISLTLTGAYTHICRNVVRDIESLVELFIFSDSILDGVCPFNYCSMSVDEEGGKKMGRMESDGRDTSRGKR